MFPSIHTNAVARHKPPGKAPCLHHPPPPPPSLPAAHSELGFYDTYYTDDVPYALYFDSKKATHALSVEGERYPPHITTTPSFSTRAHALPGAKALSPNHKLARSKSCFPPSLPSLLPTHACTHFHARIKSPRSPSAPRRQTSPLPLPLLPDITLPRSPSLSSQASTPPTPSNRSLTLSCTRRAAPCCACCALGPTAVPPLAGRPTLHLHGPRTPSCVVSGHTSRRMLSTA